ncbi:leucine--tRNA ligase [Candidatus Gottesmanbacteria bacterium RIFCSPLOWO2_02_FULL_42_29]|uniref:Leucine--tRNA ligase n=2 Tax=Candidatus Gottesmaniibacteriota TaxID=1752720 RepID=A0A1F6BK53_9BACT|nr:MAG: Leucine-tRNA ligase [Candidatus Gottesmanbacteria bacterium GW2011_GWA2_42_18]OGG10701.1 MAG: leucine--tRNA ligase [Candidatus Gottesmanbacteria bacterium RIFCSPHIGHO2_01_FULL_42_27]OGG20157.1 MAG: leucine--tRNA ligase [Candidatus Gottesmanbacteria bacterium RIFCSPHIGHO2_12_FULL_43_26]OGG34324.1 MAG: leucine--tRNA ligase [Candidatus Gottesmanbacteria bacterium RIFCSPLOWO2_12_FULL_42_10]OGG36678.1 MAG: leucine--tRNA ligase [Candidatus Gottesmanbacteria bacterium RIFCSPLOWO2_02_FULL_42_29
MKATTDKYKQTFKPGDFEKKWQSVWERDGIYQPDLKKAKKPFYNLMMFPYPSAEGLHVGNMYAFTGSDIYGRFKRMQGFDVLEPIGLDGFGIHSENYALKIGKHPKDQAKVSQQNFYRQLRSIGNSFAWKNTVETYDPDYYKWTQWIFTQMFKHGLAYRKKSLVNFCPSCKTVLSDEQVIDGRCERCKTEVEKKEMQQWFFKITSYAEKLYQNTFKESFRWSGKVKTGQRNWIGRKEGINITYPVVSDSGPAKETITCFTTRPDTNFGATFVVVGPEHPFVASLLNSIPIESGQNSKLNEIKNYVEKTKGKSEMERIAEGREKTGIFSGYYAINQLNGYKMPIYVTDFVLGHVGTGAVVGVPGHDLRDFEFAKKFKLQVIRVVVGSDGDKSGIIREEQVQEEEGMMINSEFLNGKDIHESTRLMMDYLEKKGWGKRVTSYRLRDWCISRQRYWGAPIPMIYCEKCNWQPVSDKDLPVLLPDLSDWKPEGTGKGPLAKAASFVKTKCPKCGGDAERETDVCDTFLDSSWYFLRYPSTRSGQVPWDPEITKKWLPVEQYTGGAEHTVLHLLYSRFIWMCFYDWGYFDFSTKGRPAFGWEEPFENFYAHGLIIAEGAKMSKSKGNIVNPDTYINKYGADTLRTYLMFLGPYDAGGDFRDSGIAGMFRFLGRVWRLVTNTWDGGSKTENEKNTSQVARRDSWDGGGLRRIMHKTIKEVTEDITSLKYNTAIAHIMEYVNAMIENSAVSRENIKILLLLLAPFAPHLTEELWQNLKIGDSSIHTHPWPSYNPQYLKEDTVTVVVQVNGKLRDSLQVAAGEAKKQEPVEKEAMNSAKVKKYLAGRKVKKTIFVPGRLINFVV